MYSTRTLSFAVSLVAFFFTDPAPAATINQIASDTANDNTNNSYVSGVNFDPPGTPISGNDYVNAQFTMQTAGGGTEFGGNSLTLGGGDTLGTLRLGRSEAGGTQTWTIHDLILDNSYIYSVLGTGSTAQIDGNITIETGGAVFDASTGANHIKTITLLAPVGGEGALTFHTTGNPGASDRDGMYIISNGNTYSGGTIIGHSLTSDTFRSLLTVQDGATLGSGGDIEVLSNGKLTLQGTTNLAMNQNLLLNSNLSTKNYITLDYAGTTTIAGLSFDGGSNFAGAGTYGAIGSAATNQSDFFSGTGMIAVIPEPGTSFMLTAGAGLMALRRRRR